MKPRLVVAAGALAFFGLAGCESDNPRAMRGGGTGGAPMTSAGELALPNPKPMDAQAAFFAGQIEAEVMLAKSDASWRKPDAAPSGDRAGGRGGGFSAGLGGGRRGGGGGGRGMGGGGGRRGGDDERPPQAAGGEAARGPAIRPANAPPVQLRLRLTNHGGETAEVEVLDFNSKLGNFVVLPKQLSLPPGEPVEAQPMTSQLGVPAADEIPVTVRLRLGGKSGKVETQTLKLRPRPDSPSTPEQKAS